MVSKNVKILFGECIGIFLFLTVALGKSDFQEIIHKNFIRVCRSNDLSNSFDELLSNSFGIRTGTV